MRCTCIRCGRSMNFSASRASVTKYCGQECYRSWKREHPETINYHRGHIPANAFAKGERRGKATEFQKGIVPKNKLVVGSETIRTNHKTGSVRAWVKIAEPNVWRLRALVVWESTNGPLPKGYVVHHHDRNPLNDSLCNLRLLSRKEHLSEHRPDVDKEKWSQSISAAKRGKAPYPSTHGLDGRFQKRSLSVSPLVPVKA